MKARVTLASHFIPARSLSFLASLCFGNGISLLSFRKQDHLLLSWEMRSFPHPPPLEFLNLGRAETESTSTFFFFFWTIRHVIGYVGRGVRGTSNKDHKLEGIVSQMHKAKFIKKTLAGST